MDNVYRNHSGYFNRAFGDLDRIADIMRERLVEVEYDTMVGTGLSGTLVVPTLARAFGKYWAIVRKEHSPHAYGMIEGEIGQSWLFVDDFISSGDTLHRVQGVINDAFARYENLSTKYVGTYEYERSTYNWA